MATNIRIRKENVTVNNGYFYTFDDDQDALLQKTADGTTAFSYPCDTLLTSAVVSLEFDGVNFWSMEASTDNVYIKRWAIHNYIAKLQDTFHLASTGTHVYDSDCFTVEHYHTNTTTTVSGGDVSIFIDSYSDEPHVITSAILHLGPNVNGDEEDVEVQSTVFGGVTLTSPVQYDYNAGQVVNFHKRLWLFNNNDGNDTATGALYKFDSHTGGYMNKYRGGAYKDIEACTFSSIDSFANVGSKDMLLYAKGTNMLFVNVEEDEKTLYEASTVNDSFDGPAIDNTKWLTYTGTPGINASRLRLEESTYPSTTSIISKYYLTGDFDVYVEGEVENYNTTYSGSGYMENSMKILFPNESNRFCKISRGYSTEFGQHLYQNFSVTTRTSTDEIISVSGTTNALYGLRIKRVGSDMHLYARTVTSGVTGSWVRYATKQMFDTDAQILLMSDNNINQTLTNYFDNLTYTSGHVAYVSTAVELPYYGSMVMDNVQPDEYTIIPLKDMSVSNDNLYRLHTSVNISNYELSPLSQFVTSISLSATPAIIAANGLSTSDIKAFVKDQFLQPIVGRLVTFIGGDISPVTVNTDADGFAQTVFTADHTEGVVTIQATVEQTN